MKQTIYKKDSAGKIRFLTIETKGAELIQRSGLVGSTSPIDHSKVCRGKNIGRKNETSPEAQAEAEGNALVAVKLSEDYFLTKKEAEEAENIFPMLAKDYAKESKKIDWSKPVYAQLKYDGMRCLSVIQGGKVRMLSRDGKEIVTLPHIKEALEELALSHPNVILDGELYIHGKSFQDNMRLIKKNRPESVNVTYNIYDVVRDEPFAYRYDYIWNTFTFKHPLSKVQSTRVTEKTLEDFHGDAVGKGFEGTMVRHGNDGYKLNGRSSSLLKKKDFDDVALPLLDVVPAEARPEWGTPVLEFEGKRFQAGLRFSHEMRVKLLAKKEEYIGKKVELRYFGVSEEGIPRFPVVVGFRLDK